MRLHLLRPYVLAPLFSGTLSGVRIFLAAIKRRPECTKHFSLTARICFGSLATAFAARPMAVTQNRICCIKWMPIFTMGLPRKFCSQRVSAHKIFAYSYRLQMVWVKAGAIATQMVKMQAAWYRAAHQFVHDAMCRCGFAADAHLHIAFVGVAGHHPAFFGVARVAEQS